MDVSGDQSSGNHKFMALVIGTEESVEAMMRRLGSDRIHMSGIKDPKERMGMINKVSFDGREYIGLCMRVEKKLVLEKAQKRTKGRRMRAGKMKMTSTYHRLVWSMMRDYVEEFLWRHGCEISDISFQCDADCRDFAKDMGWKITHAESAHTLADVVAWANGHEQEPKGTVTLDLVSRLVSHMGKKRFG